MAEFDLDGARKAGYTDDEIASYLAPQRDFDLKGAFDAGYTSGDVIDHLTKAAPVPKPRGVLGHVADTAIDVGKGVVSLGESIVGVGDLVTFGGVGKALDAIGYDPKQTQAFLSGMQSEERQQSEREVAAADGFWDTLKELGTHPSVLIGNIVQSVPGTFAAGAAGGIMVRKLAAQAATEAKVLGLAGDAAAQFITKKVSEQALKITAGAGAGEGLLSAGSIAEAGRQSGTEFTTYAPAALAGGTGTAIIGTTGAQVAKKLGLGNIETDIATRAGGVKGPGVSTRSIAARVPGEAVAEGLLQEAPQSAQEQVFTNLATGKPAGEGVERATATGLLTGAGMGGGHAVVSGRSTPAVTAADPVATILEAGTVDDAIAAANAAVDTPPPSAPVPGGLLPSGAIEELDLPGFDFETTFPTPLPESGITPDKVANAHLEVTTTLRAAIADNAPEAYQHTIEVYAQQFGIDAATALDTRLRDETLAATPPASVATPAPQAIPAVESAAVPAVPASPTTATVAPEELRQKSDVIPPTFEDFEKRSTGEVKVFATEQAAQIYQKQRSNRVPGNMVPRQTETGWRLSRPVAKPEVAQGAAPQATQAVPKFKDFTAPTAVKSKGILKGSTLTFSTERGAELYAKSNRLVGYKARESDGDWILSKPIRERSPAQKANDAALKAKSKNVRPDDDLLAVMDKSGGILMSEVDGADPADMASANKAGFGAPFRKNKGLTLDGMAEVFAQHGLDMHDETGAIDATKARELIDRALHGEKVYSPEGHEIRAGKKPAPERRVDSERRTAVADMSEGELRTALLTDDLTGLGNRRAYDETPKKAIQASMDVDSLKWINDSLGHAAGDDLLRAVGRALKDEGINAYHVSGDEFVAQFETEEQGYEAMDRVRDRLDRAEVTAVLADGTRITKKGVGFSYGLGQDLDTADSILQRDKQERQDEGLRAARGEEPQGVDRVAPVPASKARGETASEGGIADQPQDASPASATAAQRTPSPEGVSVSAVPPGMLAKIMVPVEQHVEGEGVKTVQVTAAEALADNQDEISAYERLLACVKAA